jgi:hypothetical protein
MITLTDETVESQNRLALEFGDLKKIDHINPAVPNLFITRANIGDKMSWGHILDLKVRNMTRIAINKDTT